MDRQQLEVILRDASVLVRMTIKDQISMHDFATRYNNFFYEYALDGHEAEPEEKVALTKARVEVELHRRVQTEVVDLLCFKEGQELESYLAAGRITPSEGKARLVEIVDELANGGQPA